MSWFKKEKEQDSKDYKKDNLEYYGEIFIFFLKYKYNFTIEELSKILLVNPKFIEEVINFRRINYCEKYEENDFKIREALRMIKELNEAKNI